MSEIPGLKKGEFGFEGKLVIDSWARYQTRNGAYGAISSDEQSQGICRISTGGDMVQDDPKILESHIKSYEYIINHQEEIKGILLKRLFSEYPDLQDSYGYDADEKSEYMPDIESVDDFKNLIGLSNVHLMNVEKDGYAYIGYEFGCTWDDEHGIGFMTHKDRIIDFGGADSSFLTWVARKDLPKSEIEQEDEEVIPAAETKSNPEEIIKHQIENAIKEEIETKEKKPWWKFW